MNKLFLSLLLAGLTMSGFSQRVYFVYLQSEQEQPFFVRLNEKVYSSSGSGYVILSKLKDSTYNLSVGFPQSRWPEQRFTLIVRGKDQGFLLKNFDTRGWGLFDLQTLVVQMASQEIPKESSGKMESTKDVSPFTSLLAKAADDSTLRDRPREKVEVKGEVKVEGRPKEEKAIENAKVEEVKTEVKEQVVKESDEKPLKPEPAKVDFPKLEVSKAETPKVELPKIEPPKTDTSLVQVKNDSNRAVAIEQAVIKTEVPKIIEQPEYKPSVVTRRSESSTSEGFGLTFIDSYGNGTKDTITIFIQNPKPVATPPKQSPREEKKFLDISSDTTSAVKATSPVQPEIKTVETEIKKEEPKDVAKIEVDTTVVIQPVPAFSNGCKEMAIESDFLKLRKLMAAAETDEDMIDEAKKYFKTKCFTTMQVKNLGSLFLNDAGKYKFFDLAYGYVTDAEKFGSLQTELKEEYYINRFKAMLRVI
jgi:hypothetical protein